MNEQSSVACQVSRISQTGLGFLLRDEDSKARGRKTDRKYLGKMILR